jgi:hypothetical protein
MGIDEKNKQFKRRRDSDYKLCITTSRGVVLCEGDYYNLRNGMVVYLFDQTCINCRFPFYARERETGNFVAQIDYDGYSYHAKNVDEDPFDIVSVHSRPSLVFSI